MSHDEQLHLHMKFLHTRAITEKKGKNENVKELW